MRQLSITQHLYRHTRLSFTLVATAPAELDSPATVTLHASTFSDVAGPCRKIRSRSTSVAANSPGDSCLSSRMVLSWQRAKYLGNQHLLPADPGLIGLNTLPLWRRLQAPTDQPGCGMTPQFACPR